MHQSIKDDCCREGDLEQGLTHEPLVTTPVNEMGDMHVVMDEATHRWLENQERGRESEAKFAQAKYEFAILYHECSRKGKCSFHSERVDNTVKAHVRKALVRLVKSCPTMKQVAGHINGKRCKVYRFVGVDFPVDPLAPTENALRTAATPLEPWCPAGCALLSVPRGWLTHRAVKWVEWVRSCDGLRLPVDLFGVTRIGKWVALMAGKVSLPVGLGWLDGVSDRRFNPERPSPRESAESFRRRCTDGSLHPSVKVKDGRIYHCLSNCPKSLRRALRFDGDPLSEVDLGCAYWAGIISQMPDGLEREKLRSWYESGEFYERFGEAAGVNMTRDELKREAKRCLFTRDRRWSPDNVPLWDAMKKHFPQLAEKIYRYRYEHGSSGFAKRLMRLEGKIMGAAHAELMDLAIPFLPLHDAVLVKWSDAECVRDILIDRAASVLGFRPLVSMK